MTEPDAQPAPEAAEAIQPEPFDEARAKDKIRKANDEARNLRQRLKELEPLAQEAERQREASKTAEQRAADATAAAEQRAAQAESRVLRLEVAFDKGLNPAQAKRLVGSTREELEADADELLATFAPPDPGPTPLPTARRPNEHLRPGANPNHVELSDNPRVRALQQIEADLRAPRK